MKTIHRIIIVLFIFVVGIWLIFSAKWFCQGYEQYQYYSGVLGSILAAIFAAFLVWVAWEELSKLGKTSSADFIHKLDNDFFTRETRTLVSLIDCKVLEFKKPIDKQSPNGGGESSDGIESQPYFEVDQSKLDKTNLPEKLKQRLGRRKYYSAWEVDDLLLGLFENIGMLERRGIVDFQMVYDVFSWYLEKAWENNHIKEYIRYQRKLEKAAHIDLAFYNRFQYIAEKCLEYEDIHPGPCMWWWKFKRHFCGPKIEIEI